MKFASKIPFSLKDSRYLGLNLQKSCEFDLTRNKKISIINVSTLSSSRITITFIHLWIGFETCKSAIFKQMFFLIYRMFRWFGQA
jgi:hypothetical protein